MPCDWKEHREIKGNSAGRDKKGFVLGSTATTCVPVMLTLRIIPSPFSLRWSILFLVYTHTLYQLNTRALSHKCFSRKSVSIGGERNGIIVCPQVVWIPYFKELRKHC